MTAGPPKGFRPHMPLAVKLKVALAALGLTEDAIEWDHDPALQLRGWDPEKGDTIPPANDPAYVTIRTKADHAAKTFGRGATTRGADIGEIHHLRDTARKEDAHRSRMLAKVHGESRPRSKLPSRGFPKGRGFR